MFTDSILETSWAQRSRRGWTTMTSFGLEALIIGLLLLLPLWKTVGLPSTRTVSTPISVGRPAPEPAPTSRPRGVSAVPTNATATRFVAPGHIPTIIIATRDDSVSQQPVGVEIGLGGTYIGSGERGALPISIFSGNHPVLPAHPSPTVRAFRTSSILEGSLIRRVTPTYPPLARSARIQGAVVLFAIISKAGTIDNLRLISGHPMLVPSALAAVSQWRYRPYILNGEPVEVETQITVNFTLAGN